MAIVLNILIAIHVLVSLLIIMLVLMQRPKSEGLGAAFGGGMTDNLFGAQSTNVLQTITRWLGCIFFGLALVLSLLYVKASQKSSIQQQLMKSAVPAQQSPATPATPEADQLIKLEEQIKKVLEKEGAVPAPTDAKPALPEATPPPTQPGTTSPGAAPAPDAKPGAPAPVPAAPATPDKPAN